MDEFHNKALEIYGDLIENFSDEEIAQISLDLYDITDVDLSEEVPDGEPVH